MRVLVVTSEWPRYENDITGIHVVNQVNRLRELGIEVSVFSFLGHKNPINYIKAILAFRHLDLEKYHVVHAHHGQAGIVGLSQTKIPVVVTFHGSDLQGIFDRWGRVTIPGRILRLASRLVARFANEVIIVSEHMKSYLPRRNYQMIPMGIDTVLFTPQQPSEARQALGLPLNKHLVLFVGDPARTEKRFWLARESVDLIKDQFNIELVIVHGVLHEMVPLYMNACDVLLLTSSSEGSPTVVKEALACNLPVVATDVGDVRERIGSVDGCVVCDNSQPATIALALQQILTKGKRIQGHEAVGTLDEHLLTQTVITVYEKALATSR